MPVDVESLLQTVLTSAKKLPGQIVGAPVDITNILMGAVVGKKLDGLVKEPVGGSAQINKAFGLSAESASVGEDLVSTIMQFATPAGAAKGAMVIPALLTKTFKEIKEADNLIASGKSAEEAYKATGVYRGPIDDVARTVVSDEGVKLKTASVKRDLPTYTNTNASLNPSVNYKVNVGSGGLRLEDVIDHPELFKVMPELKDVKVISEFGGYRSAYFSPDKNLIAMGWQPSEKEFLSTLLHEVQHAVQYKGAMVPGGNPGMFLKDKKSFQAAVSEVSKMKDEAFKRLKKAAEDKGENLYKPSKAFEDSLEWRQVDFLETTLNQLQDVNQNTMKGYRRIAGEAEARATQKMFEDREYKTFPLSKYDVPTNSLVAPEQIKYLDDDPTVKAIIDHLTKTIPSGK